MSAKVFANGRQISGKATPNKSTAAMPDVCLSPPAPPAGPVPIPYPNTASASDTTGGSKSVFVNGKEIGLKNQSAYKKSTGNEAATNNFGAGVITHKIQGGMKHAAWSFDVKVEGFNVLRHMDLTTHNHANPTNGAPTINAASMSMASTEEPKDCARLEEDNKATAESIQSGTEAKKGGPTEKQYKEKTTLTTAQYAEPNGKKYDMKGFSRKVDSQSYAKGAGTKYDKRKKKLKANPSKVKGWKFKHGTRPHSSHTECRIIEDIFGAMKEEIRTNPKAPKGKLLMRIQWRKAEDDFDWKPCKRCQKYICAAKRNGLDVEFCDNKGERRTLNCDDPKKPKLVKVSGEPPK